ncbi:MAG: signal peptidase II, partial [Blautia sp.]|nr:signal peptidase II [Blautia sp.]
LRLLSYFITAGAIGNLIDRVRLGYVVDFIYFSLIDFPVFNVADIYVTGSMILLILLVLFFYKNEEDFAFLARSKKNR